MDILLLLIMKHSDMSKLRLRFRATLSCSRSSSSPPTSFSQPPSSSPSPSPSRDTRLSLSMSSLSSRSKSGSLSSDSVSPPVQLSRNNSGALCHHLSCPLHRPQHSKVAKTKKKIKDKTKKIKTRHLCEILTFQGNICHPAWYGSRVGV